MFVNNNDRLNYPILEERLERETPQLKCRPVMQVNGWIKPSRFTKGQIIAVLKEQESGTKTADVCRKYGISSAIFDKFEGKYGGMDVSDVRRLKSLEEENARLKRFLAEQMLDNAIPRDVVSKNGDPRREAEGGGTTVASTWGEPASGVEGLKHRSNEHDAPSDFAWTRPCCVKP